MRAVLDMSLAEALARFGRTAWMLLLLLVAPAWCLPCSLFSFSTETRVLYGRNLDWPDSLPGYVVEILRSRGLTLEGVIDLVAGNPTRLQP